ncbi:M23 family metallopeptidase [Euzebya tangerina]|uniref:M23 family metallopeptidase n=1 Tax=Euzebya tangerina TaxID=591198 RepID=UPI00196B6129|nr:M23 family metallopeptidase [Euzebya tangerina]
MKHLLVVLALVGALLVPPTMLTGVAVLSGMSAGSTCARSQAGRLPGETLDQVVAETADGSRVVVRGSQLEHAATIITVGLGTPGVGARGVVVAVTAALTESSLRMLANTAAHPSSGALPNDGDGGDHDSLGLFQMRPSMGWGTVAELMDPTFQARAFFGGPTGPNGGSPPGLLDIPDWTVVPVAVAAQRVEVSAHPDRYATWEPVARTLVAELTSAAGPPSVGGVVLPVPDGSYRISSGFGVRADPIDPSVQRLHAGLDFAAPDGTPIASVADGIVVAAGPSSSGGNRIIVEHQVGGVVVTSVYRHMWDHGIGVAIGDPVVAGQQIGQVGSQGRSTGPHLHLEIRPGGPSHPAMDPEVWLTTHHATPLDGPTQPACQQGGPPFPFQGPDGGLVADPTGTGGQVTPRLAHLVAQARPAFPASEWVCWSERPGSRSEHPLGRACDVTFGNPIGAFPDADAVAAGWAMTQWLQTHDEALGVTYLIWQGQIWSRARAVEGWRPYNGGGMHDPRDPTGGHFDHLHITVDA